MGQSPVSRERRHEVAVSLQRPIGCVVIAGDRDATIMLPASSSSKRRTKRTGGLPAARAARCALRKPAHGRCSRVKVARCASVRARASSPMVPAIRLTELRSPRQDDARNSQGRVGDDSVRPWLISIPRSRATPAAPPQTSSVRSSSSAARTSSRAASWDAAVASAARRSTSTSRSIEVLGWCSLAPRRSTWRMAAP